MLNAALEMLWEADRRMRNQRSPNAEVNTALAKDCRNRTYDLINS